MKPEPNTPEYYTALRRKKCAWSGSTITYGEVTRFMDGYNEETNRYACPGCGKYVKMRPGLTNPQRWAMIPRHNDPSKE